jgi:hypothetical protein
MHSCSTRCDVVGLCLCLVGLDACTEWDIHLLGRFRFEGVADAFLLCVVTLGTETEDPPPAGVQFSRAVSSQGHIYMLTCFCAGFSRHVIM